MPFSRYQIRNEFSLADPELYKSADKDDPEALLEGVAMAGLVGVLRQLGDLAEFAAEIFHGLHEEVMVTAARGHGLLVRVQQAESDFPSIERAFLSQTGHSAFFSSSGISWHPYLQTEQNLITKGDLPRFVMDSYEESRGPPRLFLLDKFDVAGAGACLKRYTDPSFYKVEASSYEMMSAEAQRDKKIRKTKKKGSRLKNGETRDVFQPSHVKLHQLLLEERVLNGASEPARRVKLKKREIKFPFDPENGKGYMEKWLNSPPEDKLVHEVEPLEGKMVNSPMHNGSPYESPTVGKTVSSEHMDHVLENSIELQADDIEDKHISVDVVGFEDGYRSDDVASETENYMDALASMESEVETDVELRVTNSDSIVKPEIEQIQSKFSDSQSASDDESSSIMNKITTFSYSDTTSTSPENMSPHGINSQAFASTEIPFHPRVLPNEVSDNESLHVEKVAIFKESTSKESDSSEMMSSNCEDDNSIMKKDEIEIDPEDIIASTADNEDNNVNNSNSTLVILDDVFESKSEPAEANVSYSSEDETESKQRETVSVDSESKVATAGYEEELKERERESVNSVSVPDDIDSNEIKGLFTTEETGENVPVINESGVGLNFSESVEKESSDQLNMQILDSIHSSFSVTEGGLNENDVDNLSTENESIESCENKELSEESVISPELDSVSYSSYDHLKIKDADVNENDIENLSADLKILQDENETFFVIEKTDQIGPQVDVSPDVDFQQVNHVPNDQSNVQFLENAHDSPVSEDIQESKSSKFDDQVDQIDKLETHVDQLGPVDSQNHVVGTHSEFDPVDSESMTDLSQFPQLAPINMEEMPPLPPLPPMQWRMGKLQNDSLFSNSGGCQHDIIHQFPPASLNQNENNATEEKSEHDYEDLNTEEDGNLVVSLPGGGQHDIIHQFPPASQDQNEDSTNKKSEHDDEDLNTEQSENVLTSGREIIRPLSTSLLPPIDNEKPNGIRPMKIQRPRTPLIDAVAAHDKSKLRKASERAMPPVPKEEERDTLLEQIRDKSFNLKPAVQTRPSIQGPSTNLRVAAILEKANAIRQAFAGSDDDEDDNDSWSDS